MVRKSQPLTGQNLMCIVYHDVKLSEYHRRQLKLHQKQTFYYTLTFTDVCSLSDYLNRTFIVNKLVIIISGDEASLLYENIKNDESILQSPLVYELQFDKKRLKSELSDDKKFQCIDRLFEKIDDDVRQYITTDRQYDYTTAEEDETQLRQVTLPFGIHERIGKQQSFCCLSEEELKFILFQTFTEVLLQTAVDEKALNDMWISCRQDPVHQNNSTDLKQISQFKNTYDPTKAIGFYTKASFLFRRLNKAFRRENIEEIFELHPLIIHIHKRLCDLRNEQRSQTGCSQNILRRGKKLPKSVLQQLEDNKSKLISMNGFLSTTKNDNVAQMYAGMGTSKDDYQSVIFEMHIDETIDTRRPYADITSESEFSDEDEVLFSMGFVWRIETVEKVSDNNWKVILGLSNDIDSDLTANFTKWNTEYTYFTLGKVLHELGDFPNAIKFYRRMLSSMSETSIEKKLCADIHLHIAISWFALNLEENTLYHLAKAEEFLREVIESVNRGSAEPRLILAEDRCLSLMCILMNKGLAFRKRKEYENAKRSFVEALDEDGSKNHKAHVHYNFGVLEFEYENYEEARNHYSEALHLVEDQVLKSDINQRLETLNQVSPAQRP